MNSNHFSDIDIKAFYRKRAHINNQIVYVISINAHLGMCKKNIYLEGSFQWSLDETFSDAGVGVRNLMA